MAEWSAPGGFDRFVLKGPVAAVLGLPTRPMRSAPVERGAALWLGPDEWLVLLEPGAGAEFAAQVGCMEGPISLVDVSHHFAGFRLDGADAAMLLTGAVPIELTHRAFPVGMCTRTVFEKAEIVLWRIDAGAWRIEVARSFAPYLRELLIAIAEANAIDLTFAD